MELNQIDMNQAVIAELLSKYIVDPTGFAPGMTITYGALTPEYLAQRLGRPDSSQYPLGTNDPDYREAMTFWGFRSFCVERGIKGRRARRANE